MLGSVMLGCVGNCPSSGSTIKPLVNLLNVDKATDEQKSLMEELNDTVLADLLPGIEIIIGRSGKHYFR